MFEGFKKLAAKVNTATIDGDASARLQREGDLKNLNSEEETLKRELNEVKSKIELYKNADDYYDVISGEKIKEIAGKLMNAPENLDEDDEKFLKKHRKVIEANTIHEKDKKIMNSVYNNESAGIAGGLDDNEALKNYIKNKESNFSFSIGTPEFVKSGIKKSREWWNKTKGAIKVLGYNTKESVLNKSAKGYLWAQEKMLVTPKESRKEMEARLKQEFQEKVQSQIDQKMAGEWKGASESERAEKARMLYIAERNAFERERKNRYTTGEKISEDLKKALDGTQRWWDDLDKTKSGKLTKTIISSTMIGASAIGGAWLSGRIEGGFSLVSRLVNKVGYATVLNSALSSNRMKNIFSALSPKDQKNLKWLRYTAPVAGVAAAGIAANGIPIAIIGATGYGVKKLLNYYLEKREKGIVEKKLEFEKILKSEDFKDDYDRNKMIENFDEFSNAYKEIENQERTSYWAKGLTNWGTATGTGLATLIAMSPDVAHAHDKTAHHDTKPITDPNKAMQNPAPATPVDQHPNTPEQTGFKANVPANIHSVEIHKNDGGISQVLHKMENRPDWFEKVLGKDTPQNWAKLMKKIGTFNTEDPTGKDSLVIHDGDKIGLSDNKEITLERGGQTYILGKVDDHGHLEEGDWMDKMQDEKFVDTGKYSGEISSATKSVDVNQNNGPTIIDDNDMPPETITDKAPDAGPTITDDTEKIDPNKIVEPEKITEAGAGDHKSDETPTPTTKTPDAPIEKLVIDPNPYKLGPAQLDYLNNVFNKGFVGHVFKNAEALKWWDEISHTKSATDFLNLDQKIVTDHAQKKLLRVLHSINKVTGLEPMHSTVLQQEIPNETVKQYIMRGLQYAYIKGVNLDDINIEGRPITI